MAVGAVDLAAVHAIQRGIIPGRPVVQHALRERHTLRVRRDWQAEILQDRPALNNPVKARRWQSSGGRVDTHGAMSMVWTRESRVPVASGMRGSLCSISLSESRHGGQDSCRLTYYAHIGMCAISLKNGFATTMLRLKIVASGQIGKASPSYHRDLGPPVVLAHQEAVVGLAATRHKSVHIYAANVAFKTQEAPVVGTDIDDEHGVLP